VVKEKWFMYYKQSNSEKLFNIINAIILSMLMFLFLYPMLHITAASLSAPTKIVQHRGLLFFPLGFTINAYKLVFQNPMIAISYKNTLIYVLLGTIINIFLTSLGAYALSRKQLMIRNAIMLLITFTMFFSGGLIPSYLLIRDLHLQNTIWVLLIPNAISAYNLIIMRTYFLGLPDSLEESAKMDGAGDFTVLFKIMLPIAKPIVAVMVLFYGVGHWNSWFSASIYLRNRELFPLQLILREILIQNATETMTTTVDSVDKGMIGETVKYATIVVATLPILFIYPFLQKYFVKGVMIGSIKE
jgi:putative aldouronate transport system permease protein